MKEKRGNCFHGEMQLCISGDLKLRGEWTFKQKRETRLLIMWDWNSGAPSGRAR